MCVIHYGYSVSYFKVTKTLLILLLINLIYQYNIVHTSIDFEKKGSVCETNCDAVSLA